MRSDPEPDPADPRCRVGHYVISHNVYYVKRGMVVTAFPRDPQHSPSAQLSSQIYPVSAEVITAVLLAGLGLAPSMVWRCISMCYAVWLMTSVKMLPSLSCRSASRLVLVSASAWSASSAWLDPVGQRSKNSQDSISVGCNRSASASASQSSGRSTAAAGSCGVRAVVQALGVPVNDVPCRLLSILATCHLFERSTTATLLFSDESLYSSQAAAMDSRGGLL